MAKRKDWREGYVPTPAGARLLRVDRNSEREAMSVNTETGEAQVMRGCYGFLIDSDGTQQKIFVRLETLEKLGLA